jgi:hypothetical protein
MVAMSWVEVPGSELSKHSRGLGGFSMFGHKNVELLELRDQTACYLDQRVFGAFQLLLIGSHTVLMFYSRAGHQITVLLIVANRPKEKNAQITLNTETIHGSWDTLILMP